MLLKGKKIELKVDQIELYKNLNMYVIKLQESAHSLTEIKEKYLKDILKSISDICLKNSIKFCYIPELLPDSFINDKFIKKKYSGQYIYMSLLWNMIHILLANGKEDIENIEVAIICGENDEKLNAVINLLLSKIKYLTIVSKNDNLISENINKIYQDTGLSIRITSDEKKAFKDIDLIINLNNFFEFKSSYKLKSNAIIINFSNAAANWVSIDNIIVNKINIGLPVILKNKINQNLNNSFNSLDLSEIILSHKKDIEDDVAKCLYKYDKMQIMSKCFNLDGYTIEGFFGRRGFIKNSIV